MKNYFFWKWEIICDIFRIFIVLAELYLRIFLIVYKACIHTTYLGFLSLILPVFYFFNYLPDRYLIVIFAMWLLSREFQYLKLWFFSHGSSLLCIWGLSSEAQVIWSLLGTCIENSFFGCMLNVGRAYSEMCNISSKSSCLIM